MADQFRETRGSEEAAGHSESNGSDQLATTTRRVRATRNKLPKLFCVEIQAEENELFYAVLVNTSPISIINEDMLQFLPHRPLANSCEVTTKAFMGTTMKFTNWFWVHLKFANGFVVEVPAATGCQGIDMILGGDFFHKHVRLFSFDRVDLSFGKFRPPKSPLGESDECFSLGSMLISPKPQQLPKRERDTHHPAPTNLLSTPVVTHLDETFYAVLTDTSTINMISEELLHYVPYRRLPGKVTLGAVDGSSHLFEQWYLVVIRFAKGADVEVLVAVGAPDGLDLVLGKTFYTKYVDVVQRKSVKMSFGWLPVIGTPSKEKAERRYPLLTNHPEKTKELNDEPEKRELKDEPEKRERQVRNPPIGDLFCLEVIAEEDERFWGFLVNTSVLNIMSPEMLEFVPATKLDLAPVRIKFFMQDNVITYEDWYRVTLKFANNFTVDVVTAVGPTAHAIDLILGEEFFNRFCRDLRLDEIEMTFGTFGRPRPPRPKNHPRYQLRNYYADIEDPRAPNALSISQMLKRDAKHTYKQLLSPNTRLTMDDLQNIDDDVGQ